MIDSLKKRLILILLILMLFAWVSSAVLTVIASSRVLLDQVDRQLNQYSDVVWYMTQVFAHQDVRGLELSGLWEASATEGGLPFLIQGTVEEDLAPALNVWHGEELVASLQDSPRFDRPQQEGFGFLRDPSGEGGWRVLVRYDQRSELWTLVGIDMERARWAILGIFGRALFPLLVVLPLTVLILYYGVSRGLRPLQLLATQIGERSPQLLQPIEQTQIPSEIEPVVDSLNQLLIRLGAAMESEQRFTANAAHELMTPLAAIKAEVQLCQKQVGDEGREMLSRIVLRVDRATHTVQQLLTLARLDPDMPLQKEELRLDLLLAETLAETGHLAVERGIGVELSDDQPVSITGNHESLAILCRNLLSNAFRYASADSDIEVRLAQTDDGIILRVCNDCEAIAPHHLEQLSQRFFRIPGSADTGAGLGLSIVARVAALHGASLNMGPRQQERGFAVTVQFPAGRPRSGDG
jgi:signal transduction histidine kinase